MNNNSMNFGIEGPMVTGWWYNPQTGDKFNALDNFFEDNNLLVKTADGRLLNYNQIQNYVHVDREPQDITPQPAQPAQPIINDMPMVDDDIYPSPMAATQQTVSVSADYDIINRALDGKVNIDINTGIRWSKFPKKEIEMLIDVLNIRDEDIIEYIVNSITADDVIDKIKSGVKTYINNQLYPEVAKATTAKATTAKATTAKATTAKATTANSHDKK